MQSVVVIIIIVHTSVRLPPQAFAFTFWNYRFRFAQFSNFWVNSQAKWKQEKQPRCELLQYPGLPFLFIWLHQASRHLYKLMYNADGLLLLLILGCCSNNAVGMTFCGRKKKIPWFNRRAWLLHNQDNLTVNIWSFLNQTQTRNLPVVECEILCVFVYHLNWALSTYLWNCGPLTYFFKGLSRRKASCAKSMKTTGREFAKLCPTCHASIMPEWACT